MSNKKIYEFIKIESESIGEDIVLEPYNEEWNYLVPVWQMCDGIIKEYYLDSRLDAPHTDTIENISVAIMCDKDECYKYICDFVCLWLDIREDVIGSQVNQKINY